MPVNEYGPPVGDPVQWTPGQPLGPVTLTGRTCRLEPLDDTHVPALYAGLCVESPAEFWTYMSVDPLVDRVTFAAHIATLRALSAAVHLVMLLPDGTSVGIATWLRLDHAMGAAEVGHITCSASLQRTTASTEAIT